MQRLLVCVLAAFAAGTAGAQDRVVSMNVCTDQLAMLLAAPGQLISISHVARDPVASTMAAEAAHYPTNRGQAEEIFLLEPDIVLAGTYTTRATVEMLRRLGIRVEEFAPLDAVDQIPGRIIEIGEALGRREAARDLADRFSADLAALASPSDDRPRTVILYANSYTAGGGTLAHSVLDTAGLANIAAELGLPAGGRLALERLLLAEPELIVTGEAYAGAARAEEVFAHPALAHMRDRAGSAPVAGRDWTCGTPAILGAIRSLVDARRSLRKGE